MPPAMARHSWTNSGQSLTTSIPIPVSILDDEFLTEVKNMPQKNLAVKVLGDETLKKIAREL
jgi:hypothetical protein